MESVFEDQTKHGDREDESVRDEREAREERISPEQVVFAEVLVLGRIIDGAALCVVVAIQNDAVNRRPDQETKSGRREPGEDILEQQDEDAERESRAFEQKEKSEPAMRFCARLASFHLPLNLLNTFLRTGRRRTGTCVGHTVTPLMCTLSRRTGNTRTMLQINILVKLLATSGGQGKMHGYGTKRTTEIAC